MQKVIVITGNPFSGKRRFAEFIDNKSKGQFSYIPAVPDYKGKSLFSYLSSKEGTVISVPSIALLDVIEEGKIPILVCDNNSVLDILETAKDYHLEVYSVYLYVDIETSMSRFLSTFSNEKVTKSRAEVIADDITRIINIDKQIQHHVSYDIAINNKTHKDSHANKIKKLLANEKRKPKAQVVKRLTNNRATTHILGTKTFIYNQITSYEELNPYSKKALVKAISLIVDCYDSKIEEEL